MSRMMNIVLRTDEMTRCRGWIEWKAMPSLINSGWHRMLKTNDDEKVMRMTEELMMQNAMKNVQRMKGRASCAFINSGLHKMLKIKDDNVMRMTEDEMMIQNAMNNM